MLLLLLLAPLKQAAPAPSWWRQALTLVLHAFSGAEMDPNGGARTDSGVTIDPDGLGLEMDTNG